MSGHTTTNASLDALLGAFTREHPWRPLPLAEPVAVDALPTPALLVDVAAMERNLDAMRDRLAGTGCGLRPHAKMHKTPLVARRQLERGAVGICVAKVAEAEVMRAAGIDAILITSPVVSDDKIRRVVELATGGDLRIVVDDAAAATRLGAAAAARGIEVTVLVDLDPDMGRTGIGRGQPALELVRHCVACEGLRFGGLQQYAGQLQHLADHAERRRRSVAAMEAGLETRRLVEADGHAVELFTGGGTGTFDIDSRIEGVTDIQAGSYVFMDAEYGVIGHGNGNQFDLFEPALFVLVTAISKPRRGLITVDGGYKSFASDSVAPLCRDFPGVTYHFGGDEHGILRLGEHESDIALGDRLRMITPHCDPTINLHEFYFPVVDGMVHELWPVAARGCSW